MNPKVDDTIINRNEFKVTEKVNFKCLTLENEVEAIC